MADAKFTCDRCGNEFPSAQMKEAFIEEGGQRVKKQYDAKCLDEVMNSAGEVRGVPGDDKRAAVSIDPKGETAERQSMGERG